MPTSSTVSIIPGMETAPPERTETSSGLRAPPNCSPVAASRPAIPAAKAWCNASSRTVPHQKVGSTKAGGTGSPAWAISIRFQALLPTSAAPPGAGGVPGAMAYNSATDHILQHMVAQHQAGVFQRIRRGFQFAAKGV